MFKRQINLIKAKRLAGRTTYVDITPIPQANNGIKNLFSNHGPSKDNYVFKNWDDLCKEYGRPSFKE
jgi:hypothetical protein